jgi:membrane protease YdiL (CAAX protease family)
MATLFMIIPLALLKNFFPTDAKQGLVAIDILLVRMLIGIGTIAFIKVFLPGRNLILGREYKLFKGIIYGLPLLALNVVITIISNLGTDVTLMGMPPITMFLIFTTNMFLIGFIEEFLFRGLILNNLFISLGKTKKALYQAVWISSLFFGLTHIVNILVYSTETTLIQTINAVFGGILFCGIYLRSRNIWVAVIIHALLDFIAASPAVMGGESVLSVQFQWYEGLSVMVIGSAIQLGYGLFLMKDLEVDKL